MLLLTFSQSTQWFQILNAQINNVVNFNNITNPTQIRKDIIQMLKNKKKLKNSNLHQKMNGVSLLKEAKTRLNKNLKST